MKSVRTSSSADKNLSGRQFTTDVDFWMRGALTYRYGASTKVAFVALTYLDLLITITGVHHGVVELNPLMIGMLSRPVVLATVKIVTPPLIAWLVPPKLLVPSAILLFGIAAWNLAVMLGGA